MISRKEPAATIAAPLGTAAVTVATVARWAAFGLKWSLVAALCVVLFCTALQVFMRYFFGRPPSWAEEVAVLGFAWTAMGSLALGVHEGFHVRVVLYGRLSRLARLRWEAAIHLVTAAFGLFLGWAGWRFVEFTSGGTSAAARYPVELLHGMAPLAGALIVLFALARLLTGEGVESETDGVRLAP